MPQPTVAEFEDDGQLWTPLPAAFERVFLFAFEPEKPLPPALLHELFTRPLQSVQHLAADGSLSEHRPFRIRPKVLNVFPGPCIPLDKGSHRRAFDLTYQLNRMGIGCDLLVGSPVPGRARRVARPLHAIAPRVVGFRKDMPSAPFGGAVDRLARRLTKRPRRETFAERLRSRASRNGATALLRLVDERNYEAIIINYAWATGLIDQIRDRLPSRVRLICDTHDVQFVRTTNSSTSDRDLEVAILRTYDAVVAISDSDERQLKQVVHSDRVLLAPTAFDYATLPADRPRAPHTRFGFIGWSMDANVRAARLLLDEWWPAIKREVPSATLEIAGTVCDRPEIRSLASQYTGVVLKGFVPSLAGFYRDLDVVLNPVVVQGGLNFKSVEALAAGCHLVTTPLGAQCLGPGSPALIASSASDVAELARTTLAERGHAAQMQGQAWALEAFGARATYRTLGEYLEGTR